MGLPYCVTFRVIPIIMTRRIVTANRELTRSEQRDIRHLVTSMCANYDSHYKECLPLDGTCYMFCIGYTGSLLCKYFKNAVLPLKPELEAIFDSEGGLSLKRCKYCGKGFAPNGRQAYCCEACELNGRRRDTAERTRKYRRK